MAYCKVPLKSLLVLTVLLLTYVLVGVAPISAPVNTLDWAAVRGTDNGVYVAAFWSDGSWGSWQSLGGSTPSPPGMCEAAGYSTVYVFVRGMDNGIYHKSWMSSSGWSAGWVSPPGGGRTIDQPACAYLDGFLHVVVRGTGNELYWNSWAGGWTGWVDLHGKSSSAPVLVSTPSLDRIDLFVQGTDNGIYHKTYTGSPPSGTWSSWNSPGGKTSSKPAAAFWTYVFSCKYSCSEIDDLILVVRGTDNKVYFNYYEISPKPGWGLWQSLNGATLSAPTLAYDANSCLPGSTVDCNSVDALAVQGTNDWVYHKTLTLAWSGSWDLPAGVLTENSPALAYVPGSAGQFLLLYEGGYYYSPYLYAYTVTGSTWSGNSLLWGATNSDPALVAVL